METKYAITKLNGENYFNWKLKVEMLLREKGVWMAVGDKAKAEREANWETMDEKARATIILLVEDDQLQHVRDARTAFDAWHSLKEFYQKDSAGNRVFLMRSIMQQKASESDNIEQHVSKMKDLFQRLLALGEEIKPDFFMAATLMGSLPDSYDNLITALEARKEEELKPSYVQSKIIDEYKRRSARGECSSDPERMLKVSNYSKKYCNYCRKRGHTVDECFKKAKKNEKNAPAAASAAANLLQEQSNNEFLFYGNSAHHEWIVDSGASRHFSGQKSKFIALDQNFRAQIVLADGKTLLATGIGTVRERLINDANEINSVTITDVLYVPGMRDNFISVKQLANRGFAANFTAGKCLILQGQYNVAVADLRDGVFYLRSAPSFTCAPKAIVVPEAHTPKSVPSAKPKSEEVEIVLYENEVASNESFVHKPTQPAAASVDNVAAAKMALTSSPTQSTSTFEKAASAVSKISSLVFGSKKNDSLNDSTASNNAYALTDDETDETADAVPINEKLDTIEPTNNQKPTRDRKAPLRYSVDSF